MPLARPTLAALVDRIRGDLRGRLSIVGPLLRRAMVDVLAAVWAGGIHTLYGYLDWLSKQIFATSAERFWLLKIAAMYGITPVPATFAAGNVAVIGVPTTVIPINTILRFSPTISYRVTAGQVVDGAGVATLPVVAQLAGAASNLPTNTVLPLETPIAGITSTKVAAPGILNGNDEEGTESVRDRLLQRLRKPPEGGADQDYIAWARAVAGVTRAWTYPNELGLGTVVERFVRDNDAGTIFPDAGEVAAVQAKLQAERPITAEVTAMAPTNLAVAFTIHLNPDTGAIRTAVTNELTDLLRREAEPGDGLGRGKIRLSHIHTAIGTAEGVDDYSFTIPAADVVPGVGQLPTLGVITWV